MTDFSVCFSSTFENEYPSQERNSSNMKIYFPCKKSNLIPSSLWLFIHIATTVVICLRYVKIFPRKKLEYFHIVLYALMK